MKKAHIISHTHWDREWYLPYEKHHMLYIEMMDTLIDTMEQDPEYKSFHLDGQTIMLEDYLQVRPQNKERLQKLIDDGRILIGPWYVLQDEFLTSSEANVRNLQMGYQVTQDFGGKWTQIGYFPDSFGNVGQAPQLLKKAGIDTAVFGRGVKPTGFNNQTTEAYESAYSEMNWESGDGSSVLGILFANWYNNGVEIPKETKAAKAYWDKKLADAEKFASTEQLLFMNGCDHQPVQRDLSLAIRKANELYPDVEFVHSNFNEYVKAIKREIPDNLNVIQGELCSQKTDGWYTLTNTASARIYLKQWNARCEMLFEKMAEPLAAMASKQGMEYPYDLFTYGWKLLMQNHPHDSICGCSVDAVHREMVTRFEKAEQVALHIIDTCLEYLKGRIDTGNLPLRAKPFLVVNTTGWERSGAVELELETERMYFSEASVPEVVKIMHEKKLPCYQVLDQYGNEMEAVVTELPDRFGYDLPKDKFRQPYIAKCIKLTMNVSKIPAFGWDTFILSECQNEKLEKNIKQTLFTDDFQMENEYLKVKFKEDGSFSITNKEDGHVFDGLGIFEDCGDIGNEYIFFAPQDDTPVTTKGKKAELEIMEASCCKEVVRVTHTLMLPKQADELLDKEIHDLVEFKNRKASRGKELVPFEIVSEYTLEKYGRGVKVKTSFDNHVLDHRLRALFESNINTDCHYAESVFEVVQRSNIPSKEWENPSNAQRLQSFVNIHTPEAGLTIATKGLNEYEVLRDGKNTIAITLHRGVRELGDWGVFLTPQAQCLGQRSMEYEIIPHAAGKDIYNSYKEAYQFVTDWIFTRLNVQKGSIPMHYEFVKMKHLQIIPTALKRSIWNHKIIMRFCNMAQEDATLDIEQTGIGQYDLIEKAMLGEESQKMVLGKKEIRTLGWS